MYSSTRRGGWAINQTSQNPGIDKKEEGRLYTKSDPQKTIELKLFSRSYPNLSFTRFCRQKCQCSWIGQAYLGNASNWRTLLNRPVPP